MDLMDVIFSLLGQQEIVTENLSPGQVWMQIKQMVDRQKKICKKLKTKKEEKTLQKQKALKREKEESFDEEIS